jgi:NAD(P)H dehydrogenase (quinone)
VSREDCAAVAAAVLTGDGHEGRTYDVTGPQLLSQTDVAALLAEQSGRPVELLTVDDETYIQGLIGGGLPEPAARALAVWGTAIRGGYLGQLSTAVQDLTGRPPRSLGEVLSAHRDQLLQAA